MICQSFSLEIKVNEITSTPRFAAGVISRLSVILFQSLLVFHTQFQFSLDLLLLKMASKRSERPIMCSAQSLSSPPNVAVETGSAFVWLTSDHSWP